MTWQTHWYIITHLAWIGFCLLSFTLTQLFFYFRRYRHSERDEEVAARNPTAITNQFFREYWYWLIRPLLNLFPSMNLPFDGITRFSVVVGLGAGVAYAYGHISTAGWLLLASGGLDTLDGQLAREQGISSDAGAFFDSVMDRYADFFVFAGIVLRFTIMDEILNIPNPNPGEINTYLVLLTLLCMLGSNLISYSKERGVNLGAPQESSGLMQRADRVVVLGVASILDPFIIVIARAITDAPLVNFHYLLGGGLAMIAFFGNYTAIRRIMRIKKNLANKSE